MSDPNAPIGYAAAVDSYRNAGWIGVLPIERRRKYPPPSIKCPDAAAKPPRMCKPGCECVHYTGYQAIDPSYPDIMAWSEDFPDGNLCLRMPDGVIGIDVDAYGAKTGADAFVEAIRRWGPLPWGPRSSSREGDLTSGIRLFRVPPGTKLETIINFTDLGVGDIEIIQPHHRYAVCWPSVHPEGGTYQWRDQYDVLVPLPRVDELPELPQSWLEGLKVVPRAILSDSAIRIDIKTVMTAGDPSVQVTARLGQAFKELNHPGASRHDTCNRHVMALARMGKNGQPGVERAMRMLCDMLVALRAGDGSNTPEGTRGEFIRMLTNDNLARELSQPGIADWIYELIGENGPKPATAPGTQVSPSLCPVAAEAVTKDNERLTADPNAMVSSPHPTHSPLEAIEQGFWDSRESLRMIYQTSMARMCSPWAVLGHCAARAITQVRPHVVLPPIIGGPGSLNFFAAVVAASGGGKGASSACARTLVTSDIEIRNVGSGEGIIAMFGRPQDDADPTPQHEALMFNADEVDTLSALNQRSASTTLGVLRSGFSGETLGFSYAAKEKRRHIVEHSYRMTMVVSMQPTRSGWLLADEGGGTPQRFMWFPGTDSRVSRSRPWATGPLTLPQHTEWLYPREIKLPQEAIDTLVDEHVKRQQGDAQALDGHALFCREKFAYALTVLDGRVEMTLEDWELSGIAALVSVYTREMTVDSVREAANREAVDRGDLRGVEFEAADVAKAEAEIRRIQRVTNWLLHKLEASPDGISRAELGHMIAGRDHKTMASILDSGTPLFRATLVNGVVIWHRN